MVNVANVSLEKSCKSKQEREKYDGKNIFEYSFCQCVGLMHGLTEIEKKVMSFRIFVIPNNSLLQVKGQNNWPPKGAIFASCNNFF